MGQKPLLFLFFLLVRRAASPAVGCCLSANVLFYSFMFLFIPRTRARRFFSQAPLIRHELYSLWTVREKRGGVGCEVECSVQEPFFVGLVGPKKGVSDGSISYWNSMISLFALPSAFLFSFGVFFFLHFPLPVCGLLRFSRRE